MPTQTWYISGLNQSDDLDEQGLFIGSVEVQPDVNCSTVNSTFHTLDKAQALFKIHTTADTTASNFPSKTSGQEGSAHFTGIATPENTAFVNGAVGEGASGDKVEEGMNNLSRAVFGHAEAFDLFSNGGALIDSFQASFTQMETNLQTAGAGDASVSVAVANAMMYNYNSRFTLQYNAAAAAANTLVGGVSSYKICRVTGAISGALALATVVLSAANTLTSITVTSLTSGTFVEAEEVSITDPTGLTALSFIAASLHADDVIVLNAGTGALRNGDFTGTGLIGVYTDIAVASSGSGAGAKCTCIINADHSVKTIYVTTIAGALTQFAKNEIVTFTNGGAVSTGNIQITSINSIGAAMLNGTLDETDGTELPMESNDTIRVKYTIPVNGSQKNPQEETVTSGTSTWFFDFKTP
jgi:hypothetical protein